MTARTAADLSFAAVDRQAVAVRFDAPAIVSDAGLLSLRQLDVHLGYLADLARRLPDPRDPERLTHPLPQILAQQVYQLLAGYADCNDADSLRDDPLFQTLAGVAADPQRPLASGSTLARFQYAFTRRQRHLPEEDRPAFADSYQAQSQRLTVLNQFLIDTFVRTRVTPPAFVILDLDATDDPVHGKQALSGYHGYYQQHQYLPLLVFDGSSGFPLACWLRPGACHAALGAVDILRSLVAALRRAWPHVTILVRGDCGLALPAVYEFCEAEGLLYVLGYPGNAVLQRRTQGALTDLELAHFFMGCYEPHMQRFLTLEDYQADSWTRPRRIVCKLECTPQGSQRRFVVTNLSGDPRGLYRGIYVQRGAVPEQPLGELKNGLDAGRLSAHGFRANAYRLLLHVVAYGLVVLWREAAAAVPEVSRASVGTLRQRLWKVGAWVEVRARQVTFHVGQAWPWRDVWVRAEAAVRDFVQRLGGQAVLVVPEGSVR
jgi:hypothetical protein